MEDADHEVEEEAPQENEEEPEPDDNEDDDEGDDGADHYDDSPTRPRPQRPPTTARSNAPIRFQLDGSGNARDPQEQLGNERSRQLSLSSRTTPVPGGAPPPFNPMIRAEALSAATYDIVPTIAAPHSTSINAVTATPDMRWVFSGGSDGWIRKFNWVDTVNSKSMLTVAQRHPFVDSVTKAGVLMSYWENEETTGKHSDSPFLS